VISGSIEIPSHLSLPPLDTRRQSISRPPKEMGNDRPQNRDT
jgi:hypothetical protein